MTLALYCMAYPRVYHYSWLDFGITSVLWIPPLLDSTPKNKLGEHISSTRDSAAFASQRTNYGRIVTTMAIPLISVGHCTRNLLVRPILLMHLLICNLSPMHFQLTNLVWFLQHMTSFSNGVRITKLLITLLW